MWLSNHSENKNALPSPFPLPKTGPTFRARNGRYETKKNNYNLTPRLTNRVKWTLDLTPGRRGQLKEGEKKYTKWSANIPTGISAHQPSSSFPRTMRNRATVFKWVAFPWNWAWQKSSHLSFVWVGIFFFLSAIFDTCFAAGNSRGRPRTLRSVIKTLQKKRLLGVQNFVLFRVFLGHDSFKMSVFRRVAKQTISGPVEPKPTCFNYLGHFGFGWRRGARENHVERKQF